MNTPPRPPPAPSPSASCDEDYWINEEFGPPSLRSLSVRIATFRADPNHRSARVTGPQLARTLRRHERSEWPDDVVAYLLDLLEDKLPAAKGREPTDAQTEAAYAHLRDQYRDLQRELGRLRQDGGLEAWRGANGFDHSASLSDMAIEKIRREHCPHITAPALRNIFSRLPPDQFSE